MEPMKTISDYLNTVSKADYPKKTKEKLIEYMSDKDFLDWVSSARITDRITGEKVESICQLDYNDGEFEWSSSEIYLLEKYNLKISDEFIEHVLKSTK